MKRVKDFIKKNPEPAKPANVNPGQLGQYSAVNQVSESASLNQYLQSRGIDPEHLSTATKIAYAKSSLFLKWKRDHMNEDRTVSPSPAQTKLNKLQTSQSAHKEIKTPRGPGVHSEAAKVEDPAVKAWNKRYLLKQLLTYLGITEEKKPKPTALERFRKAAAERVKKHKEIEKNSGGMTAAIDRLQKQVNKEDFSPLLHSLNKKADKEHNKDIEKFVKGHKQSKLIPSNEDVTAELKQKLFNQQRRKELQDKGLLKPPTQKEENEHIKKLQADIDKSAEKEVAHAKKHGWKVQQQTYGRTYTHPKHGHIDMNRYGEWQHRPQSGIMRGKGDLIAHGQSVQDLDKHISSLKEEVEQIDELKKSTVKSWLGKQEVVPPKKPGMDRKAHNQRIKTRSKSWDSALDRLTGRKPTSEDVGDPKAATQSPADGANGGNELSEKKKQMSKSARMIKALYKKKGMVKEDLFDGEKEDKSVKTYGKKPKFDKAEKDEGGENKPESAAVLTGGTTLTGTKRDEVEIDPLMRNRPGQPDVTKKDDKKKDGKKEDKKKDK